MTGKHRVEKGESLATIAEKSGLHWAAIWDHPDNAKLKEARKSPLGILVGDELVVPERIPAHATVTAGAVFRFVMRSNRPQVRLVVAFDGKPVKGAPFELTSREEKIKGTTTDAGEVIASLPVSATSAELRVTASDGEVPPLHYRLLLGALSPPSEDEGVQQRLQLAGFYTGPADGKLADDSALALRDFQRATPGLTDTGVADASTQSALGETAMA